MPALCWRRMITLWVRITRFLLLWELLYWGFKPRWQCLKINLLALQSHCRRLSLLPPPRCLGWGSRIGVSVSHRNRGPASNSRPICLSALLLPPEGLEVTEKQLPNTSLRMCDSLSSRPVYLMLVTKDLTHDLSAPDESPAVHWKTGLPHTAVTAQQRVTFKGCLKTIFCLSELCFNKAFG